MHIYHYAHYEPSALKRLMSLHGTREAQLDDLLRGEKFVDLYKVVREAIRTSEPGLSIKDIEMFYMPPREGEVTTAGGSIVHYERWRVTQDAAELEKIRSYNEDDCRSTHLLRDWLLTQRPAGLPWFVRDAQRDDAAGSPARTEDARGSRQRLARHREALLGGLPDDRATWGRTSSSARARLRSAGFPSSRREAGVVGDVRAAGHDGRGADRRRRVPGRAHADRGHGRRCRSSNRSSTRSRFPSRKRSCASGKRMPAGPIRRERLGEIVALDEEARTIGIKVWEETDVPQALSIGPEGPIGSDVLRDAVWRFAESLEQATDGSPRARVAAQGPAGRFAAAPPGARCLRAAVIRSPRRCGRCWRSTTATCSSRGRRAPARRRPARS